MSDEGAYEVAKIIYNIHENNGIRGAMIKYENILMKFNAFRQMLNSHEYGHYNYALITFCIKKRYLDSIRKMKKNRNICIMFHTNIADVSIENNNLDALLLSIEELGNVNIRNIDALKEFDKNNNLSNYLREIIELNGFDTCYGISKYYEKNFITLKNFNKVNIHRDFLKYLFNGKYLLQKYLK